MRLILLWERGEGRPRKTWEECVMHDLHQQGLRMESALDRAEWRGLIRGNRPTPAERRQREVNRRYDDDCRCKSALADAMRDPEMG